MEKTGYLAQWPLLIPSILAELVRVENEGMVVTTEGEILLHLWFGQPNVTSGDLDFSSENFGNPKVKLYSTK